MTHGRIDPSGLLTAIRPFIFGLGTGGSLNGPAIKPSFTIEARASDVRGPASVADGAFEEFVTQRPTPLTSVSAPKRRSASTSSSLSRAGLDVDFTKSSNASTLTGVNMFLGIGEYGQ